MEIRRKHMRCVVCGAESTVGGQYCSRCGAIIAEPIRSDDPRLVEAKEDLRKAIVSRQSTDIIIEPLWAIVPLILTVVGSIVGLAITLTRFQPANNYPSWTAADTFSNMRDFFLILVLFSLASATIFAIITYGLVKRRNEHFSRENGVRMALVKLVKSAAWSRERYDSVFPELRIMEQDSGRQQIRNPFVWCLAIAFGGVSIIGILPIFLVSDPEAQIGVIILAIALTALVGFVSMILMLYMFYWLGRDFKEHDARWNEFGSCARNAMSKLGLSSPTPARYGPSQLPERSFILYLLVTLFFSPFIYYWWYTLMKDPNEHFRAQWKLEDELLASIADKRRPSTPFIPMTSTQ